MAKGRENKPHIGIFGRRNNGKSSLINALAGQDIAIVSDIAGTTTDPVRKSIEIPEIGPAILIDTAGFDDVGELGEKRVEKSMAVLKTIDLAVLLITSNIFEEPEEKLIEAFNKEKVPFIVLHNKSDIQKIDSLLEKQLSSLYNVPVIDFSSVDPSGLDELVKVLQKAMPATAYKKASLLGDIISAGDVVLLITPIDAEAPEGRMILPQVQAIRDILDNDATVIVSNGKNVKSLINKLNPKPDLVITDSQVFEMANEAIPSNIPLTSFSIMLARHKGNFEDYLKGTPMIASLKEGDRVLILESCTHHVVCDDIGREKIPKWLKKFTGVNVEFDVVAGLSNLPRAVNDYKLVIQCGGCVITQKQLISRLREAIEAGVPVTNYGMAIAWMHGIFTRAVEPFLKKKIINQN